MGEREINGWKNWLVFSSIDFKFKKKIQTVFARSLAQEIRSHTSRPYCGTQRIADDVINSSSVTQCSKTREGGKGICKNKNQDGPCAVIKYKLYNRAFIDSDNVMSIAKKNSQKKTKHRATDALQNTADERGITRERTLRHNKTYGRDTSGFFLILLHPDF